MSEVLVPFDLMDSHELAHDLQDAVRLHKKTLLKRNLGAAANLYSRSIEQVQEAIEYRQNQVTKRILGAYAILADNGKAVGAASILCSQKLVGQRLPLPAIAARLVPFSRYTFGQYSHMVNAWSLDEERLSAAYKRLVRGVELNSHPQQTKLDGYDRKCVQLTASIPVIDNTHLSVTTEPVDSSKAVHEAIIYSGLKKVGPPKRIDDGYSGFGRVPKVKIYADGYSTRSTE